MNPTNSRLDLVATCRLAACLPVVQTQRPEATEGTAFHAFLDRIVQLQQPDADGKAPGLEAARAQALEEAPEVYRAALASLRLETLRLDPQKIVTELAIAYDVATGKARPLGRGIGRQYGELSPTEYAGTLDRGALIGPRDGYVGDYKRGGWTTKRAAESWQLRKCSLDFARAFDLDSVVAELIRIDDDGETWHDEVLLTPFHLDGFALELEDLHHRIQKDRASFEAGDLPPATLGTHCRWCPSAPYCPARMAIARSVIGGENLELARIAGKEILVSPESAPRLWELVERADDILETVHQALKDYARTQPFVLSDGRIVGPVPWTQREVTGGPKAVAALTELLGPAGAQAAATVKVSLEGLRDGCRVWLGQHPEKNIKGSLGKKEEEVFDVLVHRGLARRVEAFQIRAQKPGKKPALAGKEAKDG